MNFSDGVAEKQERSRQGGLEQNICSMIKRIYWEWDFSGGRFAADLSLEGLSWT